VLFNITKPLKLIIYLIIIFKLLFLYGVRGCVAEVIMMIAEVNHKNVTIIIILYTKYIYLLNEGNHYHNIKYIK
jgi:hypothetical protein